MGESALLTEPRHYRGDARAIASAIRHDRLTSAQVAHYAGRAAELLDDPRLQRNGRLWCRLMQVVIAAAEFGRRHGNSQQTTKGINQ